MTDRNTSEKQTSRSEIDLLELFKYIGLGLKKFAYSIVRLMVFVIGFAFQNILWLFLIIGLGFGLGYLMYSVSNRYYSSEMVAQPNGFTSMDMVQYVNDIHEMTEKGNTPGVMDAFQINEESAKKIKNIEAFYFIDVNYDGIGDLLDEKGSFNPADTTKSIILDRLLIRAEVFDNSVFHEVKSGLNYYLNNNPYLIAVNELRKAELISQIEHADHEINKLDSLQDFEYFSTKTNIDLGLRENQIVLLNDMPTQLYYKDKSILLSRKLQYIEDLQFSTNPITVIKDFSHLEKEENPVSEYLVKYGLRFAIIGYIFLLLFRFRKVISRYYNSIIT